MRVLLIEDDPMLANALRQSFQDASYAVDWVKNGEEGAAATQSHDYGAVLLDLGIPKKSGLDVLSEIRRRRNAVPVLIISARDSVADRVAGLDLGADDYVVKPFDVGELLARLRAVVRRKSGSADPVLENGRLSLDPATRKVCIDDQTVLLSAREFSLLHALILKPGAILSRRELEERIYGWNEEVESNAVEFLIHGVRRKLGGDVIKNVRGLGWTIPRSAR